MERELLIDKLLEIKQIDREIIDTWSSKALQRTIDYLLEKKEMEYNEETFSCLKPTEDYESGSDSYLMNRTVVAGKVIRNRRV